jgi:integrase
MTNAKNGISVWVMDYGRGRYILQWKDPVTGKRRSKTTEFSNYREALVAAAEHEKILNSRIPKKDGSADFDFFVDLYRDKHLKSLRETSLRRAIGVLNVFGDTMRPKCLADITTSFLTDYADKLRHSPAKRSKPKKKPGPSTPLRLNSESNIALHLRTIRAALAWAKEHGYIAEIPAIPKIARAKRSKSKGRPLTWSELAKMLRATHLEVGKSRAKSWRRFIFGLRLSGLRLDEALELTWCKDDGHGSRLWVDLSHEFPLLGIEAESEKGKTDRLLPLVPEFGVWLMKVPPSERTGFVFNLDKHRNDGIREMRSVSKVISNIGKRSGVIVNASGKFASAHDMRRSFGLQHAQKMFPADLMLLMRHESIETTMTYYAVQEATGFAKRLWASYSADIAGRTTNHTTADSAAKTKKQKKP